MTGRALAQERRTELSGGWSYAHEGDLSIPGGWYGSAGQYVNNWFGIVEVSGRYKTITESGIDTKRTFHIFAAGPRFTYRKFPRGSALAGRVGADVNESVNDFAYQSNFGVTINNREGSLGLRVSVGDYGVRPAGKWTNDSLFETGVVLRR